MSAHTIEELRKHMETVDRYCPAQAKQINSALDELEALRAAKSEHKRTRREIRRLRRFLQWEPASMVDVIEERERLKQELFTAKNNIALLESEKAAAEERLLDDVRVTSEQLIAITKERNNLLVEKTALENKLRAQGLLESENAALSVRLTEFCWENARLASKANGVEDEHAKFVKAIAEALGVPEGETRSLVGVASELRRHADAKVNTNADVCAVEALEEMKARLEGMRETRDQAAARCTDLREQLRIELGNKEQWRLAAEQLQKERADLNAQIEAFKKVGALSEFRAKKLAEIAAVIES